jgi:protein-S-isoprenylcysteine O-methyltransferase Ste14
MNPSIVRPASAANIWLTSTSALLLVGVLLGLTAWEYDAMTVMIACLVAMAAPIGIVDILWNRVYRRRSAGLGNAAAEPLLANLPRVAVKLLGLWLTLALIALLYWALPEYGGDFYAPFYDLMRLIGPVFAICSIPYFLLVDRRMSNPRDGYWLAGRLLLGELPDGPAEREILKHFALGWAIKAFFLPLMTVFLFGNIQWMSANDLNQALSPDAFGWWLRLAFFIDVAFAAVGYMLTLRVLDSHIRSANPLLLGWVVAIICYPPFWNLIEGQYLKFSGPESWEFWLASSPVLYSLGGTALLGLIFFYSWSTAAFGLRFSNLTHRGIITGGPYALTKHPAYIAKNIFWWLSAMPFLSSNGWEFAVKGCLLLGVVNAIYFVRARTEERHLAQEPVYAAYARWIAEHGVLGRLTGRSGRRSTGYGDWRRAAVPVVLCGAAGILALAGSAAVAQAGAPQSTLMAAADAGGAREARADQSRSDRPQHSDPLPGPDGAATGSSHGEGARGRAGGGGNGTGGAESGRGR